MAISVADTKCTGCGACVEICPLEAISVNNGKAVVNNNCAECGACIEACSRGALSFEQSG